MKKEDPKGLVEYQSDDDPYYIFYESSFPLLGGRERELLEEIEGYPAPGCWHTKPAPVEH